jgi:hypothetical protein
MRRPTLRKFVSRCCVGAAIGVVMLWLLFVVSGAPGQIANAGDVHFALNRHAVSFDRVTPIPLAVGRAEHPEEKGPFFRSDPIATIPYLVIACALLLVPTTGWLVRTVAMSRAEDRMRRGLCVGCGYDLRASTTDRCPECGRGVR